MTRRVPAAVACLAVVVALSGCSDEGNVEKNAPSGTPVPSATRTSAAGTSSPGSTAPSAPISATGTRSSGAAHVGIVIDQLFQVIPRRMKTEGDVLLLDGKVDAQGVFSGVRAGGELRAPSLSKRVNVVWMSADTATKVESWGPCASSCKPLKVPADAQYVLVQSSDAGLVEITEGTGITVQMTKANVPANSAPDRATSTLAP